MSRAIDSMYGKSLVDKHELREHVSLLKGLASMCDNVVEFGFRTGTSATAILSGNTRLLSIDKRPWPKMEQLRKLVPKRFSFKVANTLTMPPIDECDMLFIDTWHTEDQLWKELTRHSGNVKRWIALHDTDTFGKKGEDKKSRGLWFAVERFLDEYPWRVILHFKHSHGFTVLERTDLHGDHGKVRSALQPEQARPRCDVGADDGSSPIGAEGLGSRDQAAGVEEPAQGRADSEDQPVSPAAGIAHSSLDALPGWQGAYPEADLESGEGVSNGPRLGDVPAPVEPEDDAGDPGVQEEEPGHPGKVPPPTEGSPEDWVS